MGKIKTVSAGQLDWATFEGSLPLENIVRVHGDAKSEAVARMRKSFAGAKPVKIG